MKIYDFDECVLLDNKHKNTVKIEPTYISASISMDGCSEVEIQGIARDYDWKPNGVRLTPVTLRDERAITTPNTIDFTIPLGVDYGSFYKPAKWKAELMIKDVIFNDPATIVFWADGTKTVVQCQDDDIFDPEKGLAMAISKKALGNKGNYCNELKKWLPKDEEPTIAVTIEPFNVDEMHASLKRAIKNIENACKQKKEK